MRFAFVLIVLALQSIASACIWDADTLRDERRGLPGIAELLAGRYERHSAFFYEGRAKRSEARVKENPNDLAAWDDLAVAYEKLGQVDRAIETIERKAALKPGEYTTEANWGTFLVHRGDYEAGLEHLREALRINPDAHFGREKYQVMAVEYLIATKSDPTLFEGGSFIWPTLAKEVLGDRQYPPTTSPADVEMMQDEVLARMIYHRPKPETLTAAITGVVGMIRFGPGTSPHLYAALGDLLLTRGDLNLAYRAFLRARDNGHPAKKWIDSRLEACRQRSNGPDNDIDDAKIAAERTAGETWVRQFQRFEDDLVRAGKPTDDAALAPFYAASGGPVQPLGWMSFREMFFRVKRDYPGVIIFLACFAAVGLLVFIKLASVHGLRRTARSFKPAG